MLLERKFHGKADVLADIPPHTLTVTTLGIAESPTYIIASLAGLLAVIYSVSDADLHLDAFI